MSALPAVATDAPPAQPPLCIDCDGTLLHTDLLHEALLLLVKQSPRSLLSLPAWLAQGKAFLKARLAERVRFDWASLPYRESVLELLRTARAEGRRTVLATASPKPWAEAIATHLGLFDDVVATEGSVNLSGAHKADRLAALLGEHGFDYAGNDRADLPVWRRAHRAIVVSPSARLVRRAQAASGGVPLTVVAPRPGLLDITRALRLHQWLKNLLVLVPLAAGYHTATPQRLADGVVAFFAFGLCASAVYLLNDLLDLDADRLHVRKRRRPFAAGVVPVWQGAAAIPLLLALAASLCLALPPSFALALGAYFAMTLAYSVRLKRQVIVDVLMLAGLYTLRIIAGAAATGVQPSFWLLAFSMFIFLSIATVKRYSELLVTLQQSRRAAAGRGYTIADLPVLMSLGVSAGMAAVTVFALYIHAPQTQALYPNEVWLWALPPLLLYWVCRLWMKAHRGEVDDDPLVFAVRDRQSLVVAALIALGLLFASGRW